MRLENWTWTRQTWDNSCRTRWTYQGSKKHRGTAASSSNNILCTLLSNLRGKDILLAFSPAVEAISDAFCSECEPDIKSMLPRDSSILIKIEEVQTHPWSIGTAIVIQWHVGITKHLQPHAVGRCDLRLITMWARHVLLDLKIRSESAVGSGRFAHWRAEHRAVLHLILHDQLEICQKVLKRQTNPTSTRRNIVRYAHTSLRSGRRRTQVHTCRQIGRDLLCNIATGYIVKA